MLNTICVVFPLVETESSIEDGTLCENVSQVEACNCSTSYLASIKFLAVFKNTTFCENESKSRPNELANLTD